MYVGILVIRTSQDVFKSLLPDKCVDKIKRQLIFYQLLPWFGVSMSRNTVFPGISGRVERTRHTFTSLTSHDLLVKGGWTVALAKSVLRLAFRMQRLSSLTFSKCLNYDLSSSLPFFPEDVLLGLLFSRSLSTATGGKIPQ